MSDPDRILIAAAAGECHFDGVKYAVVVDRDALGEYRIRLTSSNPPRGLNPVLYEFTGRLPGLTPDTPLPETAASRVVETRPAKPTGRKEAT